MAVLFLFLSYFFLIGLFVEKNSFRSSILKSAVIWFSFAFLLTEGAGVFRQLSYQTFTCAWGIYSAILFLLWIPRIGTHIYRFRSILHTVRVHIKADIVVLGLVLLTIAIITFFITRITPPNTFDAMEYHLSRIEHWIQNMSVNHYPTASMRQLYINPGTEYIILQFRLLSGSAAYANLIQWFAFIGCCIAVSGIGSLFSLPFFYQLVSMVLCATVPMVILQSTSTQTDLVTAFWITTAAYFFLRYRNRRTTQNLVFFSLACSFAFLTKSTAYFFLFPFLIIMCFYICKQKEFSRLAVIIGSILVVMGPYLLRNWYLFHDFLGPEPNIYLVGDFSPNVLISNLIKSISVQLMTPYPWVSSSLYDVIRYIHEHILHIDINDARTTWPFWDIPFTVYIQQGLSVNEGVTSNTAHFLLFLIAAIYGIKRFFHGVRWNAEKTYAIAVVTGYILFLLCIRWQPWQSRLQLPFFVLMTPILAYFLSRIHPIARWSILSYIIALSFYPLFYNGSHALLGPMSIVHMQQKEIMFRENQKSYEPYTQITSFIKEHKYHRIGLFIEGTNGFWDYPFWYLLMGQKDIRIEYVHVTNVSADASQIPFTPDMVICIDCSEESKALFVSQYPRIHVFGADTVYTPETDP